jgi:hypothetical protein
MKKLFLFKAVGSYLGGMAGATAETVEEAFKKIQAGECGGYNLLTETYVEDHSYLQAGVFIRYKDNMEWGFVFFDTVFADKDMVFCEIHDG